jgi:transposase
MGIEKFTAAEWRRLEALRLRQLGLRQRDIAVALEVTDGAVSQWLKAARLGGAQALSAHPRPGGPSKLTAEQRSLIPDFLWHGAEAYGFRGEVWTCLRVAAVLEVEFGVPYSRSQVSRLLKKLGWTPQIPLKRAIQRDEAAIQLWCQEVWPEVKKQAMREHRTLVFIDESGFYLLPEVVRTYAPKGRRPVQREWQTHDHLSVMGGLTPQGRIYTWVRQDTLVGADTVDFLMHLLKVIQRRLLIVWDRSPIHRCAEVQEFLAAGAAPYVHIEPLPPYAPDLNPVEWIWGYVKETELRNMACLDLEQLHMEFHLAVGRIRQRPQLTESFFAGAGLPL